ncbi:MULTISPECIES: CPBP family intramembrane glutamic endopeptidase [unclassified Sphingomonas]|uniref:CPBP family intramembrane glutamic endopeptidase n=1 Tax=unclassified Sphingomonas TaxID=196159 RepID=UPI002151D5EB|nr:MULTISPECIES: CPBP family intramembrane glutamic endopeptidase [unclassified Sphingomonas]MCR5869847.1 CPBP family intramembrane metalloprotease [Sphingomonas sp. J344]UUX98451.1 CPBP family intramembrane metalloprotease [Sphingomonas sp. J315]
MGAIPSVAPLDVALLIALVGAYIWYVRGDRSGRAPADRIASYRRWMRRAPLAFGASAVAALLVASRWDAIEVLPPEFAPLIPPARQIAGFGGNVLHLKIAVLAGFACGAVIGLGIQWWRARQGKRQLMSGKFAALLPRTPGETGWTAALGITAGVVEELFFRLALPLFVARVSGDALLGMALATALFAYAHRYQGWAGVAASALVGVTLTILYLATSQLWFAMLVHALLNLNALVLRPLLVPVSSSAASRS